MQPNESETWVEHFLNTKTGKYFVQVDPNYIKDQFNLYGLKGDIDNFKQALDIIQSRYKPISNDDPRKKEYEYNAYQLYGLLHKRYIQTQQGIKELYNKYIDGVYGKCPLVSCHDTCCLPYGIDEIPKRACLCLYCPSCHEVYNAEQLPDSIDGAFFGHSYLMIFYRFYHDKLKINKPIPIELRLFGFKIEDPPSEENSEEED